MKINDAAASSAAGAGAGIGAAPTAAAPTTDSASGGPSGSATGSSSVDCEAHLVLRPAPGWEYHSSGLIAQPTGLAVNLANGDVYAVDWRSRDIYVFDSTHVLRRKMAFTPCAVDEDEGEGAVAQPLKIGIDPSQGVMYLIVWSLRSRGGYHSSALYVCRLEDGSLVKRIHLDGRLCLRVAVNARTCDVYLVTGPGPDEPRYHRVLVLARGSLNAKADFQTRVPFTGSNGIGVTACLASGRVQLTDQAGDVFTYDECGALVSAWTPTSQLTGTVSLSDGLTATYDGTARAVEIRDSATGAVRCKLAAAPGDGKHASTQSATYNPYTRSLVIALSTGSSGATGTYSLASRGLGDAPHPPAWGSPG